MMNPIVIDETRQHAPKTASDLPITFRGVVYSWHLDHMGHMNVQHYVGMFDHASWVLLALLGLDASYFRENHRGMAAVEQNITYKSELLAGDSVEIRSGIIEVRDKTIRLFHTMRNVGAGTVSAHTTIVGVFLDTDVRKSLSLPAVVRERARRLIVSER